MAQTTTWKVNNMRRNASTGGVELVYWECRVIDNDDSQCNATEGGKLKCTPDPSSSDFIAYDSVTEANCIAWVQAQVDKDATEANLAKGIDNLKNPPTMSGRPWAA